ncbi:MULTISPECIES: hybrid sensor histidine kinase/response regulator [unclassified Brevundimonas]|jgi:signal transduction histidine kinase|uniref:hybrid sensor histidine kinase/response regulator n=3 Tax=Brevundimonas TaxID=41275 RepID=UPI00036B89A7|nr:MULTISPECIES: hybrid sensor histidine kinase/response regulator [unclassified Brevundimonas]MCW0046337.1 hybrid sensor histidine kinase/response regulator [Brevundimonas sp. BT-123]QCQ98001.1 hybrid sensor histidine kinase/response regulator [Brevundimonas sp. SGAir0440]
MTQTDDPIPVLLVDDLQENLLALEALLRRDGLTFLKARTGDEALELLLAHDVALALLDVQMPGMDGFQLAEYMRGSTRTRHVPIIFVTAGSADHQRRFRGYEAGAVDFIQKPIEADILSSKAEVFFDLFDQRRQMLRQRDELEAYAAQLRAADRRKDEFLAVLGHELRNPLMALRAGLQLLEREADGSKAGVIRERMGTQVLHLSRLIEDLLDVSRIDQGKIALRLERVSLQAVLESAIDTSRPKIDAGLHALTVELPDEPAWIAGDFTRLSQVVSNLLTNAAKYTPAGGELRLSAGLEADFVQIEVEDNGVGVPPEMQERIFALYTQVPGPDTRSSEGLGIGLALVKQLVELHRGSIAVSSEGEDQGSRFTVRLPRSV